MTVDQEQLARLQAALGSQYRFEGELGRGGMGIVYLARDVALDRPVAVKVVHPELSTNRAIAARFLAEARTIARLRHPSIVAVHAAGEVDGLLYYVMDYHAGETLRQRLTREGRLAPDVVTRIVADIAGALDTAAAAGVVHRDLKPENILLEGSADHPRALLADFGIARLVEGGAANTGPGAVMGTPAYMSPEQAAGDVVDGRSDLYSLGIVAYEMLTGAPPFTGPPRVVISKQILDPPPAIEATRPGVPPALTAAVLRALEKTPDARWSSGRALEMALRGDVDVAPPRRRAAPRRWRTIGTAAVALLVAAAVAAAAFIRANREHPDIDPRQSLIVLPFDNLRNESALDWLRTGSVSMLTLALSQWQDLSVVDQHRVHDLLENAGQDEDEPIGLELARRMARSGGARTIVLGDFSQSGDSLHLVARTYDVESGRRLEVIQVDGPVSTDVRPLFDRLATRLLDLSGAPDEGRASLASVTTESLEAYRAYLHGVDALHHWRLTEASEALERAVTIDSTFGLAHYHLAVTRGWISNVDTLGVLAIRRASRYSEYLPDRERGLIEAYRTFLEGDFDRSLDVYGQLVARDSSDVAAWYGLADASFHGGYARRDLESLTRSLRGFRRVARLDSGFALAYEHMGQLLADAAQPSAWFVRVGEDSLAPVAAADSAGTAIARARAVDEAVRTAQGWIRAQPGTPRAHYHLYKALLIGNRVNEARQVVSQLRTMFPDSVQSVFGFFDARAQLVGGDLDGAARTVRQALPTARPDAFAALELGGETRYEVMTGASALAYYGDLDGAARVIRLSRDIDLALDQAVDSAQRSREAEAWELGRLAELMSGAGAAPARLRALWNRGATLARGARTEERAYRARSVASAALGVFLATAGSDTAPLHELRAITGRPLPRPIEGLVALRLGDSARARTLLQASGTALEPPTDPKGMVEGGYGWGDLRPYAADAYYQLGDYGRVVDILRDFEPTRFSTRGFDSRWAFLPRVRLLRAAALEQLGQRTLAAAQYRAVVEQWGGADTELLAVVQQARAGLARLEGTRG